MNINELDNELLGSTLKSVVFAAYFGSHTSLASATESGIDDDSLEFQYVKDLLNLPMDELIDTWFGGAETMERHLDSIEE